MKKFLTENWYKLIIISLITLISVYFIIDRPLILLFFTIGGALWFTISNLLKGKFGRRLLGAIFIIIVTPIAYIFISNTSFLILLFYYPFIHSLVLLFSRHFEELSLYEKFLSLFGFYTVLHSIYFIIMFQFFVN